MNDDALFVPSAYPSDLPANSNQMGAVEDFYAGQTLPALSDIQASTLLDIRDYSRAVIKKLEPDLFGEAAREIAEKVAVYISRDREIAEAVVAMMRRRFDRGADHDGLVKAIARLEFYEDIEATAEDILATNGLRGA